MPEAPQDAVGLCVRCTHARRVASARGSIFWRCQLAERDPGFTKYPRLPVIRCDGYTAAAATES